MALIPETQQHGVAPAHLEQICRERWETDPDTRAEFREFERYLSYQQAAIEGRVRIH